MPIGQLTPFAQADVAPRSGHRPFSAGWDDGTRVYAGPGWVGGRLRQVESWRGRQGYLLRIEDAGEFEVSGDGARVGRRQPVEADRPDEEIAAAVLGPCLVLALALRGVWCLHASAAGPEHLAVALAGESGAGKSTLAAALAADVGGWRRIADDLLPLRLAGEAARALPRYPQSSLAPQLQWRPPAPAEVDLAAVCVLEPGGGEVEVRALPRRQAALALVRQTVAARLFDAGLQGRHLGFCAELAQRLPVRVLRFPRRREALPAMTAAIVADLGAP